MQMKKCRMCKSSKLNLILDLGHSSLSDGFLTKNDLDESETSYPLNVLICKTCGLCQLGYTVSPEKMFNKNYPYDSSTTSYGREHFHNMGVNICNNFNLESKSLVVDVGSNYDNSNYRYTVPDTGVYFVSISLVLPTMTGGADLCYLRIYVNGTQSGISDATESKSGGATGNAILQCHMVGLMALTAGQYIEAYVYETAGTRVAPTSGSAFCGFRLS